MLQKLSIAKIKIVESILIFSHRFSNFSCLHDRTIVINLQLVIIAS